MIDCRHPRRYASASLSRDALDRLRDAWDWARQTHPAVQAFDKGRPALREIGSSQSWALCGVCPDGRSLHACIIESQLRVTIARPGPSAPIAQIVLDLPARLGGHPKAA